MFCQSSRRSYAAKRESIIELSFQANYSTVCVRVHPYVYTCLRACVRACVRACMSVCERESLFMRSFVRARERVCVRA